MEQHHQEALNRLVRIFEREDHVRALLLGGSIAHGFAQPDSDIDVSIVVDTQDFARRQQENRLLYYNAELCAYEGGYIDGKYTHPGLLKLVAERGSEPARYAFKDCRVLFSHDPEIERLLARIVRYPAEGKGRRIERFAAQVQAWRWYYGEAVKKRNRYLAVLAIQKIVLFSGRIVLTVNEMLYPFHKWLLTELGKAERKPAQLLAGIEELLTAPTVEKVDSYCATVLAFAGYREEAHSWPNQFMLDSELNWLSQEPPVDDL